MHRRPTLPSLYFAAVRADLDLPRAFPPQVDAAARAARDQGPRPPAGGPVTDATDVPFITVDPPGSMDLDQALHVARLPRGGYRLQYAIADVAAFVAPGDPVDTEARRRGETLYCPDTRIPLHPAAVSEDAASLLPGQDRPAVVWRIDVDADGDAAPAQVRRATVRSRARLTYTELQGLLDRGTGPEGTEALADLGRLRLAWSRHQGAIDLGLPQQEVEERDGTWHLVHRVPLPVERWNAHLSLLTGMAAARIMLEGGVGLLRTLPAPEAPTVDRLRAAARALRVPWPRGASASEAVASVDPTVPAHTAFLEVAASLLRGAGYTVVGTAPLPDPGHAGVGAPYAHVTAPIRRLADRFATEVCLALADGRAVPDPVLAALEDLPALMAASGSRARALDRAVVDLTEAWLLHDRVGQVFDAAVVATDDRGSTVVLDDPPVRARAKGDLPLGERVQVRLTEADPTTRTVRFEPA